MAANGHGGKRTPRNPAPVSGPGSLSRRTDGKQGAQYVSGMPYGEGQDFYDLQTSARMNESGPAVQPAVKSQGPAAPPQQVTPLFAPTERPNEPITAGAPFGPGPGPAQQPPVSKFAPIVKYLPALEEATKWQDAPENFRALVRFLQGQR